MTLQGPRRPLPPVVAPRLFEAAALTHPATPALRDAASTTWLTYSHLDEATNKLARCLLRRLSGGASCENPDGDRVVAVCLPPSARLVTCLLAIHKAGAAYLPLEDAFPAARVAHILRDARPALLLVQSSSSQAVEVALQEGVPVLHLEDLHEEVESASDQHLREEEVGLSLSGDSVAVILYTSGSTGVPKGVRVPHKAVLNRLAWQWRTFPYQPEEMCCFKTALTFVDSISEIFGPLLTGHSLVVVPKAMIQAVDDLVTVLDEAKVGRLVLVPSLLRSILLHCSAPAAPKLNALRLWVCSGEVLPADLLHAFFTTFTSGQSICNFYGSTEVMGDVTFVEFHGPADASARLVNNKVPIGRPIDNCRVYLMGSDGQAVVGEGVMGEVYAAGLNTAMGYVGGAQPDKFIHTQRATDPEYTVLYRTGDYAREVDGLLVFEGRADSQIKVRGHRVDMSEVEMAVKKVKGADKVTVICYKPGEVDQALLAFYTSPKDDLTPGLLKQQLTNLLQPYMQPQVINLEDFPLLVNGKVDRQELLRIYERRAAGGLEDVPIDLTGVPEEEAAAARVLLVTVGRVLGPALAPHTTLGLDTNFFHVGGNSLNSVLAVTSLKDMGYSVGVGDFMRATSLREVLQSLKKEVSEEEGGGGGGGGRVSCRPAKKGGYSLAMLDHQHKRQVLDLFGDSFSAKGDLEQWLKIESWEYKQLLEAIYTTLVEEQLSFVYTQEGTQQVVACSLNFDMRDEPSFEGVFTPKITYIFDFLEACEAPCREGLPKEVGHVMHSFGMGTLLSLGPAENVELIQMMEEENLKLAKKRGFKAIFTTNTSALTQQVCDDLLSYTVLKDMQVNTWVARDSTAPFRLAPDSQNAVTTVKFI